MEAMIVAIIAALVPALLAWFFSGSTTTKVETTPGLEGLDRKSLSGNGDLTLKDLPNICLLGAVLLLLSGCAVGGAQVVIKHKLVEPGDVVEIVDGKPMKPYQAEANGDVQVRVPGSDEVGPVDPVGKVMMPRSTYRLLRADWEKNHPSQPVPDTKPAPVTVPVDKPKPTVPTP